MMSTLLCLSSLTLISNPFMLLLVFSFLVVSFMEMLPGLSVSNTNFSYGSSLEVDFIGFLMIVLLFFIVMLMVSISFYQSPLFLALQLFLTLVLTLVFMVKTLLWFYVIFEVSLIPIGFMILMMGYQPERIQAMGYMFMYTIVASMPLLLLIMELSYLSTFSASLMKWIYLALNPAFKGLIFLFAMMAFLVKLPVYGLHMWLPKAHVEAPLEGSIILAGLLLKVGGFGMVLFLPVSMMLSSELCMFISFCSGLGGVLISMLCLRIMDLKMMIAYSSVAHMAICLMCIFSCSKIAIISAVLIMLAHGISSPAMFTGAFNMYTCSKSRNLMLNSGGLSYSPAFTLWWFLACLANMAAPPTLNLISEVLSFISLWWESPTYSLQMGFMIFLSGAYSLIAYSFTQHSYSECSNLKMSEFPINSSLILSVYSLSLLVSPLFLSTITPVILVY